MDNNSFEQQFTNNVRLTAVPQPVAQPTNDTSTPSSSSKIPWIIIASLSFVVILQVIILIVVLTSFAPNNSVEEEEDVDDNTIVYNDPDSVFSDDGLLTAINAICTKDGDTYTFTTDGKYTFGSQSGTYAITNGNLITLDGNTDHVLYYDDTLSLADGLTIYNCDTETDTTE